MRRSLGNSWRKMSLLSWFPWRRTTATSSRPPPRTAKNVLPRVAALLDVQQISDIVAVESADTFVRPIYAGNALATVKSKDPIKVITVRTTAFDAVASTGGASQVEAVSARRDSGLSSFVSKEVSKSERPELTSAKIIVSGGRGMANGRTSPRCSSRCRQAGRGDGRLARRGGRRLRPQRLAGGADRQDRGARPVHRGWASPGRSSTSPA